MKFSELWRELKDRRVVLFDSADASFDEELERIRNWLAESASGKASAARPSAPPKKKFIE